MGTIPLKTKETETVINNYVNKKLLFDQTKYNIYIYFLNMAHHPENTPFFSG